MHSSEANLCLYHSNQIDLVWKEAQPLIQRALSRPENTLDADYVKSALEVGQFQLWSSKDKDGVNRCFFVTQFEPHVHGQVLVIRYLGAETGSIETWIAELGGLEAWARSMGAVEIQICGRLGWLRTLKPHGYEHQYTVLSKQVYGEVH